MKKNSLALVAVVLLCASFGVLAQGAGNVRLPSDASADYLGSGWNCRILTYANGPQFRLLDVDCKDVSNVRYQTLAQSNGCPGGIVIPLYSVTGAGSFLPIDYNGSTLTVQINGAVVALTRYPNGIVSPAPYAGCGVPFPKPPDRLCPWFAPGC